MIHTIEFEKYFSADKPFRDNLVEFFKSELNFDFLNDEETTLTNDQTVDVNINESNYTLEIAFQIHNSYLDKYNQEVSNVGKIKNYLVCCTDLGELSKIPTRSFLAKFNQSFVQSNILAESGLASMIVFRYRCNQIDYLSFSISELRETGNRRSGYQVVTKVILLKDVRILHTHPAHCRVLNQIKLGRFDNYSQLHKHWIQTLSTKELGDEFYAGLAGKKNGVTDDSLFMDLVRSINLPASQATGRDKLTWDFALRLLGRLIFCWFLREKDLVSKQLLSSEYAQKFGGDYYHQVLAPLFFETLNKPYELRDYAKTPLTSEIEELLKISPYLNGGLFQPEQEDFYDIGIGALIVGKTQLVKVLQHLESYIFTVDEHTGNQETVGIDPEMMGRIFENFILERSNTGSFYTPREIVDYMVNRSIVEILLERTDVSERDIENFLDYPDWQPSKEKLRELSPKILPVLKSIKILDPACGSGAYPIGVLQRVSTLIGLLQPGQKQSDIKKQILRDCIFGVDLLPIAVEISRLRAWLSIIVDEINESDGGQSIEPLPNLEFKFVCANSLIGINKLNPNLLGMDELDDKIQELINLRKKSFVPGNDKNRLKKEWEIVSSQLFQLQIENGFLSRIDQTDLTSWHPFENKPAEFFDPEWMFGVTDFDLVIGNPPYVQIQSLGKQNKPDKPQKSKDALEWEEGYKVDLKSQGYSTFVATGDLYCLFYECGLNMLDDKGYLCYITSNKWMRAGYGEKLRQYLQGCNPRMLLDFGGFQVFESATVDTNILLVGKNKAKIEGKPPIAVHFKNDYKKGDKLENYIERHPSPFPVMHKTGKSGWFIGQSTEVALKGKIESIGEPLKDWNVSINYGIKTGLNAAFIINEDKRNELIAKDPKSADIIKPILRGRDIKRYGYDWANLYIIATFPALNINIDEYSAIRDYLIEFGKDRLEQAGTTLPDGTKSRKKTGNKWFETQDQIAYWQEFEKEKIVYPNMTQTPSFYLDNSGYFVNDKAFILNSEILNKKFLIAIFNSRLGDFQFRKLCSGLGEKGLELRKIFVENFSVPKLDTTEKQTIANKIQILVNQILEDKLKSELVSQIDQLVYQLYELTPEEIELIEQSVK